MNYQKDEVSKYNKAPSFDDDIWGNDIDMDEALSAQATLIETHVLSQRPPPVENSNCGRSNKESNTRFEDSNNRSAKSTRLPNNFGTSLPNSSASRSNSTVQGQKRSLWKSETTISEKRLCPESTAYASNLKLASDEKLSLELEKLQDRLKILEDACALSETKLLEAQTESKRLKEFQVADEQRIQNNLKTIQTLESQLAFKIQEVTSLQWLQSQHNTSTLKANGRLAISPAVKSTVNGVPDCRQRSVFPTISSFSKTILMVADSNAIPAPVIDFSTPAVTANVTNEIKRVDNDTKLKANFAKVETLLMKLLIRPIQCMSVESPLISLLCSRENGNSSIKAVSSETIDKHNCEKARVESVLLNLLSSDEFPSTEPTSTSVKSDILSSFTLRNDCGEVFLRFIEDRIALPNELSSDKKGVEFSLNDWHQCLHLLKYLVSCSPRLRNCVLNGKYEDSSLSWWKAPNLNSSSSDWKITEEDKCSLLKTLFDFFNPAIQAFIDEINYDKLSEEIFKIFTSLAMNSTPESINRFLPIFNLSFVKVCKSFVFKPKLWTHFAQFLSSTCISFEMVQATCNEELCVWVILANGWHEAASRYSLEQLSTLDLRMCQLLSHCLSHEGHKPPFIVAVDCPCPFDISASLLQCIYRYQRLHESSGKIHNLDSLQRSVKVLLHLTGRDPNIGDKRIRMKAEYYSVLGWLNRLHKKQHLGPSVEALLEKYFPLRCGSI
ncbi:hypothetical protein CHUAL_007397 [Chamberlinius hualienensis]